MVDKETETNTLGPELSSTVAKYMPDEMEINAELRKIFFNNKYAAHSQAGERKRLEGARVGEMRSPWRKLHSN